MNFTGRVVLITGTCSGIGAETAKHFARLGADLVLTGKSAEGLAKTVCDCKEICQKEPIAIPGQIENGCLLKDLVQAAIKTFCRLDVLVNNAGIMPMDSIENITPEKFDEVFNVNVRPVVKLTQLAVPYLVQSQGNVVNLSSICGHKSFPGILSYCMSKAAIEQFTRCVALEMAERKVRVNAVAPGVIETGLQRRGGMDEEAYKKFMEHSKTTHAMGRVGQPYEVAGAITFLASELASFITGVTIPVDGGKHAMCPR